MKIVGIYFDGEHYYIAGLDAKQKIAFLEVKKNLDRVYDWSVSLLAEVSLKSFTVPVKNQKMILAAIPFQAEQLIPFPDALVVPLIKGKRVWLFGTKKESLQNHLERFDTPFVTSYQMALYAYQRWAHPEKENGIVFFEGQEKAFFISIENKEMGKSGVLRMPYDEEAKERLMSYLGGGEVVKVDPHGVAIGLALAGNQFRIGEWEAPSLKQMKAFKKKRTIWAYVAALVALTFGLGTRAYKEGLQLSKAEQMVAERYGDNAPLKEGKMNFYGEPPRISQIIAYLDQFRDLVEIDSLKVELLQYPSIKDPYKKYKIQVKLHFQPLSKQGAKLFQDHLMGKNNRWIDGKEEIEFKRSHDGYQATFFVSS